MSDITSGADLSDVCSAANAACLKGLGLSFLIRYYRSRDSHLFGARLTQHEAQVISAAGLKVGVVFEFQKTMAEFTPNQAQRDAEDALNEATAVGQPAGSGIYFAVDFQPQTADLPAIRNYFQIVRAKLAPKYRIGVYGSGAVCRMLLEAHLVELTWLSQSLGFDGTPGFTDWNVKQGMPHKYCGLDTDPDDAHGDFGGFTIA